MCAIGGMWKWTPFTTEDKAELIPKVKRLLLEMKSRGHDACGVGLINTDTGSLVVYKDDVEAKDFIEQEEFNKVMNETNYNLVLLHTRAWTRGTPSDNRNNHPIYDINTHEVVVHNGMVDIAKDEDKDAIECDGICDSEYILRLCQKFGLVKGLQKLQGSMAIALYSKHLYLYTNINPLTLAYFPEKELFVFASIKDYIVSAFNEGNERRKVCGFSRFTKQIDMLDYEFYVSDFMTINFKKKKISLTSLKVSTERVFKTGCGSVFAYKPKGYWDYKLQRFIYYNDLNEEKEVYGCLQGNLGEMTEYYKNGYYE